MQFMVRMVEEGVRIADEAGEETISVVYDRYRILLLMLFFFMSLFYTFKYEVFDIWIYSNASPHSDLSYSPNPPPHYSSTIYCSSGAA